MTSQPVDEPAPVRWTGFEILTVLILIVGIWGRPVLSLLEASGLFHVVYGPEQSALLDPRTAEAITAATAVASLPLPPGAPLSAVAGALVSPAATATTRQLLSYRATLWANPLAFLLQLATVAFVFRTFSGTSLAELGLRSRRVARDLLLGAGCAVVLVPLVFGLNSLIVVFWKWFQPSAVQEHPLTQIGQLPLLPAEWVLLVLAAVVIAPVWEELTFRGVLQPWFAVHRQGGLSATLLAVLFALAVTTDSVLAALPQGPGATLTALAPVLLALALLPLTVLLADRPADSALLGTSVLFAWRHASVWPTPLSLLLLGLTLGVLARYTRSLVACITLHAFFNGAACVLLLFGQR
jgi:membrane protease YdiL (CAAX protease family)